MRISEYLGGPQTVTLHVSPGREVFIRKFTGDERVSGRLKRAKPIANDEDRGAEAAEGFELDAGNGNEGTQGIQAEAPNEYSAIAVVAKDPGGVANRGQRVGTFETKRVSVYLFLFWWIIS